MTDSDAAPRPDARLIEDAKNWLPTDDPEAHRSIVGLLAMIAQAGVDPIAALARRPAPLVWPGRPGFAAPTDHDRAGKAVRAGLGCT